MLGLLLLPLGLTIGGCGGGKGTVSGKVTYNGKVVPGGTVQIIPSNGPAVGGDIGEDGRYSIANVSVGSASVVVETESAKPASAATTGPMMDAAGKEAYMKKMKELPGGNQFEPKAKDPNRYMRIPPEYSNRAKPKLQITVKSGTNDCPLDLK